jgi:hypothetical protein
MRRTRYAESRGVGILPAGAGVGFVSAPIHSEAGDGVVTDFGPTRRRRKPSYGHRKYRQQAKNASRLNKGGDLNPAFRTRPSLGYVFPTRPFSFRVPQTSPDHLMSVQSWQTQS